MKTGYYVDFDQVHRRGRIFKNDIERNSDNRYKMQYFESMEQVPKDDACEVMVADHPQMDDAKAVLAYAKQHPKTHIIITRNLDFPSRPTRDPTTPNVFYVERSYILEHNIDDVFKE